jgi:hypothetical protein
MANFRKSFNLRNGVQVDNDNFYVNENGLVGIGTSVPTEKLDVRGNVSISGFATATSIQSPNLRVTGIATITLLNVGVTSISSGVITSTNPGVSTVKYYGDGSGLTNIPTSQWVDVNVGLGFTSIYAAGTVGIATNSPLYYLQIGQSPDFGPGTGINSTGNIKASGIITAGYFSGDGSSLTTLNASNISSGTLSNSRLPSNINVGIITATTFSGSLSGTASLASNLTGSPSITVTNITSSNLSSSNINNSGIITTTNIRSGFSTTGISTVHTRLYAELIGVGTNSPASDIHVRRTSTSTLQLTSDSAETIVTLGRSTTLTGSNGALRFGNTNALYPYSTTKSLDIINYDTGNVNNYLQLGSAGVGTGSFNWFYGQTLSNLMTLTYGGNLGIGITLPTVSLHVVGTSTVTNSVYAGTNIYAGNNVYVGNNLTVNGSFSAGTLSGNVTGNVTGNLAGNVYSTGLSTFSQATITTNLGIGTIASVYAIEIGSGSNKLLISNSAIGINTTTITGGAGLDALQSIALFKGVGIGTTSPRCYADFSDAGTNALAAGRFMLPPKVTTTQRNALATVEGAFIYNTSNKRLELYNGSAWVGIATIA